MSSGSLGSGHFHETVPVLDAKGHMHSQEVERELGVDIALRWNDNYDTTVKSFVNVIATPSGGTHVTGFDRSITKVLNEQLRAAKILKASEDNVIKDDVLEGMTAVITVGYRNHSSKARPRRSSVPLQHRELLPALSPKQLGAWFSTPPRGSKAYARAALDKVANASRVRLAARQQRDVARRKTALESSALLKPKLVDCRSGSNQDSELFIVEAILHLAPPSSHGTQRRRPFCRSAARF